MISKELLSEVLFNSRVEIKDFGQTRYNNINYSMFCSINERDGTHFNEGIEGNYYVEKKMLYDDINIYELAHKCKEWAYSIGYVLNSNSKSYCDVCDTGFITGFEATTEPDAIFKACQWILDNE
jgi:hypothetical protein